MYGIQIVTFKPVDLHMGILPQFANAREQELAGANVWHGDAEHREAFRASHCVSYVLDRCAGGDDGKCKRRRKSN